MPIKTYENPNPEMGKDVHDIDLEIVELIKKYDLNNSAVIFIRNQFDKKDKEGNETNILFGKIDGDADLAKSGIKAMMVQKEAFLYLVCRSLIELYEDDFKPVDDFFKTIARNVKA